MRVLTCPAVQAFSLRFNTSFPLPGSEADMQRALRRQPELIEPGLCLIAKERSTGVGSLDLFARNERLVVIELKRGKATHEAVHQLARHVQRVGALQPQARSCEGCWWHPPRPAKPLVLIHPESSRARCRKRWHRREAGPFVQADAR